MTVSGAVVASVLTVVAIVIVLVSRRTLRRSQVRTSRSTRSTASGMLTFYTTVGFLAVLGWVLFLAFPEDSIAGHPLVGVVGLFFWWITALVGLRLVTRSRKAPSGRASLVVAHLVLVAIVTYFTFAYTTAVV